MTYAENEYVELKASYVPDIKKEVVAFANASGGTIYIGIRDDGTFVGLDNGDFTMRQVMSAIRDSISPDITIFTQVSFLNQDEKTAVRVDVSRGSKRPYYLKEKGMKPSGVYVRQGTSSVPASEDAIRRMIKDSDGDSFEENRSLLQELTFTYTEKELADRSLAFGLAQQQNIGILTSDGIYTNLGLLLSDQCKHSIKIAVFQGTDKLVFRDRKEFSGSIFKQMEEAYHAIDYYNAIKATVTGIERLDERDYPPEAIREALFNAIVHRDYGFSGSTLINLYADRMEFISLGDLVPGLSLEAVLMGASQPRNEKLAALFFRMRLIEAYGTGFGKMMSSYASTSKKPIFENVTGAFRVTLPNLHAPSPTSFPRPHVSYPVVSEQETMPQPAAFEPIVQYIQTHRQATRKELEVLLHLGTTRTTTLIREMLEQGIIRKIGNGKNTRYALR